LVHYKEIRSLASTYTNISFELIVLNNLQGRRWYVIHGRQERKLTARETKGVGETGTRKEEARKEEQLQVRRDEKKTFRR
jgi:hypothetical protein